MYDRCSVLTRSEKQQQIAKRLAEGQTVSQIASDLGVARSTVHRIKSRSVPRKGPCAATSTVVFRATSTELASLDHIAARHNMSRSALLRRLARFAGDYVAPSPEEEAFLANSERHLVRLGGNFNQIAAALSASVLKIGRADPTEEQATRIRDAADEVDVIKSMIRRMLINWQAKTRSFDEALAQGGFDDEAEHAE